MEEIAKDAVRPQTQNHRILHDVRAIQVELELVRVHCIELEKIIMVEIMNSQNQLPKQFI